MRALRRLGAALLAVGFVASVAQAADEGLVLRQSAERLAAAGRCEEAIEKARRARDLAPGDAEAAAIEGRCALQLKRYDAAIPPLETARRLDPVLKGLTTDLAMAHFHRGDLDAADRELTAAEALDPDDPRVLLYRGLLHLERSEDAQAAASLERAARADAVIDPLASYYAALAWERARERQKAREALLRAQGTSGPWADQARAALERLDASADFGVGAWWATLVGGVEWDDNVLLRGDEVSLPNPGTPGQISDEEDVRGFWSAELGAELFRSASWAGGAIVGYYGDAPVDTQPFNDQNPSASLWLDRRLDAKSFARLQPFIGYSWIGGDPFLLNAGGVLSFHRDFDVAGNGRLFGQYAYRDYFYSLSNLGGPPVLRRRRDRDGTDLRVGYDHAASLTDSTIGRAGVAYGQYEAEGAEYDHMSYGGYLGLRQSLPAKFVFDAEGSYAYEPYRHASTFFVVTPNSAKRRDNVWNVRAQLERPINDWISVAAYFHHVDNISNTPVFDYDRNIVGGQFTLSFGR